MCGIQIHKKQVNNFYIQKKDQNLTDKVEKKGYTLFAKSYFMGHDPSISGKDYLYRGSSLIRGEQIAQFLGAKYNPTEGFENDVRIFIKPKRLDYVDDNSYVDIVDADYLVEPLKNRPNIKVIASLSSGFQFLKERLNNDIFLIPQHHCNFERVKRVRKKVTTGGYISTPSSLAYSVNGKIKKQLKEIGFEYKTYYHYTNRRDVVNFYKQIDFQIIGFFGYFTNDFPFTHPLKIINAASFGIPTIACWKLGYEEFSGNYIPVDTMESLMIEVEKLKDKKYYDSWANKIVKAAEKYHIEKIAEKYKKLK